MRKTTITAASLLALSVLILAPGCSKKVPGLFTAEDFEKKTLNLESQTVSAMEKAYSKLPARGTLTIRTDELRVSGVAARLEKLGFIGLTLEFRNKKIYIHCYKGKEGPSYETGRTAIIKSNLLAAAIDDDNNLLFKSVKISEKTAQIYLASLYRNYVEVSDPVPELFAKLKVKPDVFNPVVQDSSAEELNKVLSSEKEKQETTVFYKGPFKMLILKDGTMIRRCQPVLLSKETAKLLETENCEAIKVNINKKNSLKFQPMNYSEKYKIAGRYFLLSNFPLSSFSSK